MDQLFLLSRIFCGMSFIFYNYIGFLYIEAVLSPVQLSRPTKMILAVLNTGFYLILSSMGLSVYIVYLCGFTTLILEFTWIYKLTTRRVVYVASTFMFNIAATRNLLLSAVALVTFQPINQISGNNALYNFALFLSFLILDIVMFLFIREKFVTFADLSTFAEAKIQENYAALLSSLIFAYIMIFSGTHSYKIGDFNLTVLNFFTPITLAVLYYVTFSYGVKMSKMFAMERRARALESQLKETMESKTKLESIAYIDPLTNAFSRRYCIEKISQLLKNRIVFSLCFIDVDKLKQVNDTYGHGEGDSYLQMISDVLRSILRHDDVISRMGGDEFVILLPNCPQSTAKKRMERAHEQVKNLQEEKRLPYQTSISFGIIEVGSENEADVEMLLAQADQLMYEFKVAQKKNEEAVQW